MDKNILNQHSLNLIERKNITITGVKKVESFDEKEFILDSIMGFINIKGSNLEIIKLDTYQGDISIKGKIDSISYKESKSKKKNESMLDKLFK